MENLLLLRMSAGWWRGNDNAGDQFLLGTVAVIFSLLDRSAAGPRFDAGRMPDAEAQNFKMRLI
jgi:hypothetical protein